MRFADTYTCPMDLIFTLLELVSTTKLESVPQTVSVHSFGYYFSMSQ